MKVLLKVGELDEPYPIRRMIFEYRVRVKSKGNSRLVRRDEKIVVR